ncbi:branched-chain amino acid ABC transporter permease [Streptomyces sp. NPDC047108]|uniref:branched-chain amino acid ABC transporter permease n=1 Tax=Streptomyces sp. NPDC047108 TaxID=3155025 RepID=UPI0033FB9CC0
MSTETTTKTTTVTAGDTTPRTRMLRVLTAAGGLATVASTFLAWAYSSDFPGNLTVYGYPGGLQVLTLVAGLLVTLFAAAALGVRGTGWLIPAGSTKALRLLAIGAMATTWFTAIAISVELGGLINVEPGGWIAVLASAAPVVTSFLLPDDTRIAPPAKELPSWAEILIVVAAFGLALYVFTYGIDTEYAELFTGYLFTAGLAATALFKSGLIARLSRITAKNRSITLIAAFVAAALFPVTQTNDQYTLVAVNILIFATVALGLNVVVGLAGLLDLGYVAFLGVGAYTAALVSGSTASVLDIQFPFWAAVLAGALASLIFGVVIGAPTLRLRGDYLAIVTLGFGEIFRIAMGNLDGDSGPRVTNGPNGIPNIPDLTILGFNFGEDHTILGQEIGGFANYYFLMLLVTAFVVLVFSRAGNSRIGRAWVAIREDETAATAMGINGFKVKLIAFALGATLAGVAGTVQAHVQYTVVPEQYVFAGPVPPSSAFLLAAVILGGMGTITGPLLGASLLYLIPAKLQFLSDYQLLFFGFALILLMRFRPEGLIADRRKQLEFHETGQLDVPEQRLPPGSVGVSKAEA